MEDYENKFEKDLKEKYDKIVVPDKYFDTARVFERYEKEQKSKKRILKVAGIVVAILIAGALIISNIVSKDNNGNDVNNVDVVGNKSEKNIVDNFVINPIGLDYNRIVDENLLSIQILQILEYKIINGIPYTKLKARVLENYIGTLEGEIEMLVPGGVFTVSELKKEVKNVDKEKLEKYNDNDYLNVTCYNQIYIPMAEVGKTYLTSVEQIDGKLQVDNSKKFAFRECDMESDTYKDKDGNVIPIEMDKYLENVNKLI